MDVILENYPTKEQIDHLIEIEINMAFAPDGLQQDIISIGDEFRS